MQLTIDISDKELEQCYYQLCKEHAMSRGGTPSVDNLIGFARGDYVLDLTGVSYVKENREEILAKVRDALIESFYPLDFPNAYEVVERMKSEKVASNSRRRKRRTIWFRRR